MDINHDMIGKVFEQVMAWLPKPHVPAEGYCGYCVPVACVPPPLSRKGKRRKKQNPRNPLMMTF